MDKHAVFNELKKYLMDIYSDRITFEESDNGFDNENGMVNCIVTSNTVVESFFGFHISTYNNKDTDNPYMATNNLAYPTNSHILSFEYCYDDAKDIYQTVEFDCADIESISLIKCDDKCYPNDSISIKTVNFGEYHLGLGDLPHFVWISPLAYKKPTN